MHSPVWSAPSQVWRRWESFSFSRASRRHQPRRRCSSPRRSLHCWHRYSVGKFAVTEVSSIFGSTKLSTTCIKVCACLMRRIAWLSGTSDTGRCTGSTRTASGGDAPCAICLKHASLREHSLSTRKVMKPTCARRSSGGWVATHEDVTERNLAERELESTRSFLSRIIENVPSPIIVKSIPDLRYLLF